jgi:hypothetical protein
VRPASPASPEPRSRHARDDLDEIARLPRPVGSAAEGDALDWCRARLVARGFAVAEQSVSFSSFVGRYLPPLVAATAAVAQLGASAYALGLAPARTGLLTAVLLPLLASALALAARFWAAWVLEWPTHRVRGTNLVATRGTAAPSTWLVAHVDTKSQPMPSLVRAAATVVAGVALLITAALFYGAPAWLRPLVPIPLLGAVAAIALSFATVTQASPGAADNATGIAALLRTVDLVPGGVSLGVLISTGEELGLAGVRAFVKSATPATAINVDTVDDRGMWRIMTHGDAARPLAAAMSSWWAHERESVVVSRLIPGILTDGVALAQAGWSAVTLSCGDRSTLLRIHTPRDSVQHLTGNTAERAAELLAGFLLSTR